MDGEDAHNALLEALREAASSRRERGKASESAGFASNYIGRVVGRRAHPKVTDFLQLAEALGVGDMGAWIRSRVAPSVDVAGMLRDLPHPSKPPTVITLARRPLHRIATAGGYQPHRPGQYRFLAELQALDSPMQPRALRGYQQRKQPCFVAALVDWLDLYRYDRPAEAARLAKIAALELVPDGHLETQIRAMAVFASAVRMRGAMTLAGMVLAEALPLAYRCGPKVEAELIQRASYVIRDHAKHNEALEASNMAASLYASIADHEGLAKVAVDRGIALFQRGDLDTAEGELKRGLQGLPEIAERSHFGARLTLCGIYAKTGQEAEALRELREAEVLGTQATHDRLILLYTQAGLTEDMTRRERLLRSANELVRQFSPFDSALICLDLLSLLIDQGRQEEAANEGNTVHALMYPLRFHPDAQEALRELARLNGKMQTRDIARARSVVQIAKRVGTAKAEIP